MSDFILKLVDLAWNDPLCYVFHDVIMY